MYLIGIDIGTSSTKGVLVDEHGKVIAQGKRLHDVEFCHPEWAEQDADRVWWKETVEIIKELLTKSKISADEIAAIGCSGICPVILPVDKNGRPLRNAILYSIDSRSTEQIRLLNKNIGPDHILKESGQPLSYQSVIPKLIWIKDNEPKVWNETESILGASGYVVFRLSGTKVVDHFTAADGGFGYSATELNWSNEAFHLAGISANKMPHLRWPSDIVGYVSSDASQATGLVEGTPVISGTGDALAEMISTGVSEIGETALLYGSTLAMMSLIDNESRHTALTTYPGWEEGQIIIGAGVRSGMSSFSWLRRLLGEKTDEDLFNRIEEDTGKVKIGADGLLAFPYLTGQMSSAVDSFMKGAFIGLSQHHELSHIMRALMEGIGFALRISVDRIPNVTSMRVVGGGVKNRLLLQIVSDICRCTQKVVSGHVGAPLGSAWLAGLGVGLLNARSSKQWVGIEEVITHNETRSMEYDLIYEQFRHTLSCMKSVFD